MKQITMEGVLRPGWYVYWQTCCNQIQSFDTEALTVQVKDVETETPHTLALTDLLLAATETEAPVFAPSRALLEERILRRRPAPEVRPTNDLPANLLARAERIVRVMQQVEAQQHLVEAANDNADGCPAAYIGPTG